MVEIYRVWFGQKSTQGRKELQEMWREKQSIIAFSVKAEPDKTCVVDYRYFFYFIRFFYFIFNH